MLSYRTVNLQQPLKNLIKVDQPEYHSNKNKVPLKREHYILDMKTPITP